MTVLRGWLLALLLLTLAVVISYYLIDRPLALFIHSMVPYNNRMVQQISRIPNPLISIAAIVFVALGLRELAGRPLSRFYAAMLICSLSLMAAETIKSGLKFVFGRTWPQSWFQNNPSFIRDGIYGFNWFHGGEAYQSFPSGHMTAICAVASVLWVYYPRLRATYVLAAFAVLVGLVGANFHFLSDTIAGAFLGVSTGLMATKLLRTRE